MFLSRRKEGEKWDKSIINYSIGDKYFGFGVRIGKWIPHFYFGKLNSWTPSKGGFQKWRFDWKLLACKE